jgi:hypothetical protein
MPAFGQGAEAQGSARRHLTEPHHHTRGAKKGAQDKGLKLAPLQFRHGQDLVAVCSLCERTANSKSRSMSAMSSCPRWCSPDDEMKGANRHQDRQTRDKTRLYRGTIFHTSSLPGAARPVLRRAVAPSMVPPVWDQAERVSAARSRRRRRTEKLAGSPDILCAQAVGANPEKATKTDASEPSSLSHPCPCCGRRSSSSRPSSVSTRPDIDRRSPSGSTHHERRCALVLPKTRSDNIGGVGHRGWAEE